MQNELKFAGFWKRLWMLFVDLFILFGTEYLLINLIFTSCNSFFERFTFPTFIVIFVLPFIFFIFFWKFLGSTPGNILGHVELIDIQTGKQPKLLKIILRYFAIIGTIISLGFGFIILAFDSRKQAWHDKIAGISIILRNQKDQYKYFESSHSDKVFYRWCSGFILVMFFAIITSFFLCNCRKSTDSRSKRICKQDENRRS